MNLICPCLHTGPVLPNLNACLCQTTTFAQVQRKEEPAGLHNISNWDSGSGNSTALRGDLGTGGFKH